MTKNFFEPHNQAFIAHFARRLADLINDQGAVILKELNLNCPSTSVSALLYLNDSEQVTISNLADALDVTHQMATQRLKVLENLVLVKQIPHPTDKRSKVLTLTKLGQSEAKILTSFTQEFSKVLQKLNKEIGCNLSESIRMAEISLLKKPLSKRINTNKAAFKKISLD